MSSLFALFLKPGVFLHADHNVDHTTGRNTKNFKGQSLNKRNKGNPGLPTIIDSLCPVKAGFSVAANRNPHLVYGARTASWSCTSVPGTVSYLLSVKK